MARQADMPERSHVEVMVRDALDAITGIDKMLRGNGGPGLGEQVRNNTRAIERLQNSVDMLVNPPDKNEKTARELSKIQWTVIGQIVAVAAAALAYAGQFFSGG